MGAGRNRMILGIAIGAVPGAALWVIGAIVGGEALLSFGVIGMLLAVVGMIVGAMVGARAGQGAGSGASKAAVGAVIGAIPGIVLLFFMTRIGIPLILVGGVIGAFAGGRKGTGSGHPTPAH